MEIIGFLLTEDEVVIMGDDCECACTCVLLWLLLLFLSWLFWLLNDVDEVGEE